MRHAGLLVLLTSACGGASPSPAPVPVAAAATKKVPPRVEPNCADMGPLLRQALAPQSEGDDSVSQKISARCEDQAWSLALMECIAATPQPSVRECLSQLDPAQVAQLDEELADYRGWEGDYDGYIPPTCETVMQAADVADWPPVAVEETQRDLARLFRRPALLALCDDDLDPGIVTCISNAEDAAGLAPCAAMLTVDPVAKADDARAKVAKLMAKSASAYSCEKVVAAHYGAAKWKGHAPTVVGASRAKLIQASKKLMRDACNGEAWSAEVRACVVAIDEPECWKLATMSSNENTWSYPADGTTPFSTGVAECDAWGAETMRMINCKGVDEGTRKALRDSFDSAKAAFRDLGNLPPEASDAVRDTCRQARDSIAQSAQSAGC